MTVHLAFPAGFSLICDRGGKFQMPETTANWPQANSTAVYLNWIPFPSQWAALWTVVNQCGARVIGTAP